MIIHSIYCIFFMKLPNLVIPEGDLCHLCADDITVKITPVHSLFHFMSAESH